MTTPKKGSLFGATLLISGCCIGGGMLALPLGTAESGFIPTLLFFFASWLFMAITGLLLLEANAAYRSQNLISLAAKLLGPVGKIFAWGLFTFLFYSLMVAYTASSGALFSRFFADAFSISLAPSISSLSLVLFFLLFLLLGTKAVDRINRPLMAALFLSYVLLINVGIHEISATNLERVDWSSAFFVIPIMVISFGYHNLIPSLSHYLGEDKKRMTQAILLGSFIPLVVYLVWDAVILGQLAVNDSVIDRIQSGAMIGDILRSDSSSRIVADIIDTFSFFAIVTSFLSVAYSFVDFLSDGLNIEKKGRGMLLLCLLSVLPPYIFSVIYPNIFLQALSLAGAFGAVVLYGIGPFLAVWKGRYRDRVITETVVPGGKVMLLLVLAFSLYVIIFELVNQWSAF